MLNNNEQFSNRLRIVGEAEAVKDSIFEFLSNFHCWVWPDEFRNFLKRHLRRKFLLENQLSNHSNKSDENPNVLIPWLCSFIDKFSELGLPGLKKGIHNNLKIKLAPVQTNFANLTLFVALKNEITSSTRLWFKLNKFEFSY